MKMTGAFEGHCHAVSNADFRGKVAFGFLGSALAFPKRALSVVEADLDGVAVERFDTLSEISDRVEEDRLTLRCLAVHEARADDFLKRHEAYVEAAEGATLILAYSDGDVAQTVRDSGVGDQMGFLPMECSVDAWSAYIRLLICDEAFVPRELLRAATHVPKTKVSPLLATLTDREHQVLQHVAAGHRNRCIAEMLNLSEHTVKLHLHNCFTKLGVSNRAAAAVWYQSQGLAT